MEIVLLVIAVAVAIALLARSPVTRSIGEAEEKRMSSWVPGMDADRRFQRNDPRGGGLL